MRVCAGLYHPDRGFRHFHFIDVERASEWLLCMDCDLLSSDVVDWDGDLVPVHEISPMIIHLHSLDKSLNRACGFDGRCVDNWDDSERG